LIASVFAAPPGPVFPAPEASRIKGFGYAAVTEEIFALRCPSGPERVLTFFFRTRFLVTKNACLHSGYLHRNHFDVLDPKIPVAQK